MMLVTGATGFVGSAVVRCLLERGLAVRALVRATSNRRNLEGLDVDVVEGDLGDPPSLVQALEGCRGLFHVAADYRLWTPDPDGMFATNVEGTRNILRAAAEAGLERIVYTSSVATLGIESDGQSADEDTPVRYEDMIGPYKQSKFLAEAEVSRMARERGLPVVIVNPSTPVGPGDIKPTPTGRLILEAVSGRIPAYVDTGLNIVHVDDVALGHWFAYEKGRAGERYVLGGENLSLKAILTEIAAITGRGPPKVRVPAGVVMPLARLAEAWARLGTGREPFVTTDGIRLAKKKMYFSTAKAERELGYDPRPAHAALVDAVSWFQRRNPC